MTLYGPSIQFESSGDEDEDDGDEEEDLDLCNEWQDPDGQAKM